MCTYGGIDTAGTIELAVCHFAYHLIVERFTHAMQALELILSGIIVIARQLIDRGQRVRVMCGKLRID